MVILAPVGGLGAVSVDRVARTLRGTRCRKIGHMSGRLGDFLSRVFNLHQQRLRLTGQGFALPDDPLTLHPAAKRVVTICNLFANQNKSIADIAELLDTKTSRVISALVKGRVIADRRHSSKPVKQERRSAPKYHLPANRETGQSDYSRAACGVVGDETVSAFIFLEVIKSDERCHECSVRYNGWEHSAISGLDDGYRH